MLFGIKESVAIRETFPFIKNMSSKLPNAAPIPDRPPLHLRGGFLCIAAPVVLTEACLSAPAVRAFRHFRPNSTLAIVCPESQTALWEVMKEVDHVISYPDKASARQIAKAIQGCKVQFESAIAWEAGEVAKAFYKLNILQRLGYPAKSLKSYLTDPVNVVVDSGPIEHRVRFYLNLVHGLGGSPFVKKTFITPELAKLPAKPLIVLSPASEYGMTYQWPVENFVLLVEAYEAAHGEADWLVISADSNNCKGLANEELKNKLGEKVKVDAESWEISQTLDELTRCSAVVSSDNILAHLAAHVGLPAAVVFGPNEPEWKRPLGRQSRVVREHVACSPCFLAKCPLDMRCQDEVSVQMVLSQLEEALAERVAS